MRSIEIDQRRCLHHDPHLHKLAGTIEAHHNSTTDLFWVNYSDNGGRDWVNMMSITKTEDDDQAQDFALPDGIRGEVLVQMRDSNRFGDDIHDQVFVDMIGINVE